MVVYPFERDAWRDRLVLFGLSDHGGSALGRFRWRILSPLGVGTVLGPIVHVLSCRAGRPVGILRYLILIFRASQMIRFSDWLKLMESSPSKWG